MSVNIFGASGTTVEKPASAAASEGSVDLQEIEQKISSLNTRKFDKDGGYITGDVSLQISESETTRTFGLSNMTPGKDFVVMLGSASNAIYHEHGQPIEFKSDHGVKFNDDVIMSNCSIGSLRLPTDPNEAATKAYVDTAVEGVVAGATAAAGSSTSIDPNQFVKKSGDSITGDLGIYIGGDTTRQFGVSDIGPSKSVLLMLGSLNNAIYHEHGQPIEFKSLHGVKFNHDIIMNDCSIGSLREPVELNQCATKNYVDTVVAAATAVEPEDSIDVSALLARKLDKTGGTMTGNLDIRFTTGVDSRSFGVSGISENKVVHLNLGDYLNGITHAAGSAIKFKSENGFLFVCGTESICQLGCDQSRVEFYKNISMRANRIVGLQDPVSDQDACTKIYTDSKFVKNQSGYIPELKDNANNKNGFVALASSEKGVYYTFRAFSWSSEWISGVTTGSIWIQIKCPFPIRIHKICLKGRRVSTEKVKKWSLQGSNDGETFTDLLNRDTLIETSIQFYDVTSLAAFSYYRVNILEFEGSNPGLNYFQIYSLDPLV